MGHNFILKFVGHACADMEIGYADTEICGAVERNLRNFQALFAEENLQGLILNSIQIALRG